MTAKEQQRAWVLTKILQSELSTAEGAERLGLSERHLWRLRVAYEQRGSAGLVHGNRGRPSVDRIDAALEGSGRRAAPDDVRGAQRHPRPRAARRARGDRDQPRERPGDPPRRGDQQHPPSAGTQAPQPPARMPAEGLLLQLDASPHDWLEGRGPTLGLLGAIDDATGIVAAALFREQEDGAGYLGLLRDVVTDEGDPRCRLSRSPRRLCGDERAPRRRGWVRRPGIAEPGRPSPHRARDRPDRSPFTPGQGPDRAALGAVPGLARRRAPARRSPTSPERTPSSRRSSPATTRALPSRPPIRSRPGGPYRGTGPSNDAGKRVEVHVRLDGSIVAFDGERELAASPAPLDPAQLRALDVAGPDRVSCHHQLRSPGARRPITPADGSGETASSTSD